jgi:hypothetical protein
MPDPTKAHIVLHQAIQDTQNFMEEDSPQNRMLGSIELTIQIGDKRYENARVQISQPYGTSYNQPFEVGKVIDKAGKIIDFDRQWTLDREQFHDLCERYYRGLVGENGAAVQISAVNVVMRGPFHFPSRKEATIDVRPAESGGW